MEKSIEELVVQARNNMECAVELWQKLNGVCWMYINHFEKKPEHVDDWYQEAYMTFAKSLETYDPEHHVKFKTFFKKNLMNHFTNLSRKRKRVAQMGLLKEDELDCVENLVSSQVGPEEEVLFGEVFNEEQALLSQILAALTQEERVFLYQIYVQKESIRSMSARLGVPYTRLDSQKRRLHKKLEKIKNEKIKKS